MIKAIFFDIDGTLLSYKTHQMLPSTVEAIHRLQSKGVRLFVSSGRPKILLPQLPIDFDGYITVNGGYCYTDDKVLLRNPIVDEDCTRWLEYVVQQKITTMCFTEQSMYINRIDEVCLSLHRQLGFDLPTPTPITKMGIGIEKVYQFIAIQPADTDEKALRFVRHCRMPRWHPLFTDVIPDNSSKAVGINKIIKHFGIHQSETMAFGDGANDIEMLRFVSTGIAMGNASEEVKNNADFITDTSENDGIYKALKKLEII